MVIADHARALSTAQRPLLMIIQSRDTQILRSIFRHRFLTTEHLHALHFVDRSVRAAQARLKELHDDNYLDRTYVLPPVDGLRRRVRPVYSMARAGAEVLAAVLGIPPRAIPHTKKATQVGYHHMLHELVVADLLVSGEASLGRAPDVRSVATLRDHDLRSLLAVARLHQHAATGVVPDGAFIVDAVGLPAPTTIYVEVVHAGVKGGNARLVEKLERYLQLLRTGFFTSVFNHRRVRALAVVSPSDERVENLRVLAERRLRHGRRFVWFAVAPRHSARTYPPTTFTVESLAQTEFVDIEGTRHHLDVNALR